MPEGPEVRRAGANLGSIIIGKKLKSVNLLSGKLQRNEFPGYDSLKTKLPLEVIDVFVKGKVIFIRFSDKTSLISTLGMSGWWYPGEIDPAVANNEVVMPNGETTTIGYVVKSTRKHARVELVMEDGSTAIYSDMRNFGNITYLSESEALLREQALGYDLMNLQKGNDVEIIKRFRDKKFRNKPIGAVLLNQEIACGLGNIYRAETLWFAGILPDKTVEYLSDEDLLRIIVCASYILKIVEWNNGIIWKVKYLYRLFNEERRNELIEFMKPHFAARNIEINEETMSTTEAAIAGYQVYQRKSDSFGNPVVSSIIGGRTMWYAPDVQE